MDITRQCGKIDVPFSFSFLVSPKDLGSLVYLNTIHWKYYSKQCSLKVPTLFIWALFNHKHVFASLVSP